MRGMITYVISVTITTVNTSVRTSVGSMFSQLPKTEKMTLTSGKTASQVTIAILWRGGAGSPGFEGSVNQVSRPVRTWTFSSSCKRGLDLRSQW